MYKVGDRIEWTHMRLTRFNPQRYHGVIVAAHEAKSGNKQFKKGEMVYLARWDDGQETFVGDDDITKEGPGYAG